MPWTDAINPIMYRLPDEEEYADVCDGISICMMYGSDWTMSTRTLTSVTLTAMK